MYSTDNNNNHININVSLHASQCLTLFYPFIHASEFYNYLYLYKISCGRDVCLCESTYLCSKHTNSMKLKAQLIKDNTSIVFFKKYFLVEMLAVMSNAVRNQHQLQT